jgi:hypothetical protein
MVQHELHIFHPARHLAQQRKVQDRPANEPRDQQRQVYMLRERARQKNVSSDGNHEHHLTRKRKQRVQKDVDALVLANRKCFLDCLNLQDPQLSLFISLSHSDLFLHLRFTFSSRGVFLFYIVGF